MSRKLLISDANIIIDIIEGQLVDAMFTLDYKYGTPDLLYAQELQAQHPEILAAGLQIYELRSAAVGYADHMFQTRRAENVSFIDCLALALAKQERCTLLTGDAKLRELAAAERVKVRGTLWLMQEIFNNGLISVDEAGDAYRKMLKGGSRLPEKEISKQLKSFRKQSAKPD